MLNYLENFKGIARSGVVSVPAGDIVRLPDEPCKFVKLSRWNVTDDEQFTSTAESLTGVGNDEVYYGFDGVLFGQLFPRKETDLLPINNLNQIVLRCPVKVAGEAKIYYTWFV